MLQKDLDPLLLHDILQDLKSCDYKKAEKLSKTIDLLELESQYQAQLKQQNVELKKHEWVKSQFLEISKVIQDATQIDALVQEALLLTTPVVEACSSAFYFLEQWSENEAPFLRQIASYATPEQETTFALGEGFVGQCAHDQRPLHIKKLPKDYLKLKSGTGQACASSLLLLPVIHENKLKGIFEIATFQAFSKEQVDFLVQTVSALASKIHSIEARKTVNELLIKSHKHNSDIQEHNEKLLSVKRKLEQTNKKVREASRYKSEFLANMSHELRTPLNSLLLLSKKLAQNGHQNLNPQEVEYAEVINNSGQDLLVLINDILDLSKIEAGKMTVNYAPTSLSNTKGAMERLFEEVAAKKELSFEIHLAEDLPEIIQTDSLRVEQVLRNFLTNSFKFTHKGSVILSIDFLEDEDCLRSTKLRKRGAIAFKIQDTGVGIDKEKLDMVFDSFQQADGTINRQYGGTGLGLSISRELAKLLEGEIHVESILGEGSTFTLYIPALVVDIGVDMVAPNFVVKAKNPSLKPEEKEIQFQEPLCPDDRGKITKKTPFVLIIEDDPYLTPLLIKNSQEKGRLVFATARAQEGIHLATHYNPTGIILDLNLSNMAGRAAEIKLKGVPATAKIPLLILSKLNDSLSVLTQSIACVATPPLETEGLTNVLNNFQRLSSKPFKVAHVLGKDKKLLNMLSKENIEGTSVETFENIKKSAGSFFILNTKTHDLSEISKIEKGGKPLLILSHKPLSSEEQTLFNRYTSHVLSRTPQGQDLLKEVGDDFLDSLPSKEKAKIEKPLGHQHTSHKGLNKNVLIVDDDMRNIFALSAILEDQGLTIIEATNGIEALEILARDATIDMVLMDIMMPGLDGHAVMELIRNNKNNAYLPVIAMSAKAMKEDRQQALEAGADEFMSKPLNTDELISVMAFWFKKQQYASA